MEQLPWFPMGQGAPEVGIDAAGSAQMHQPLFPLRGLKEKNLEIVGHAYGKNKGLQCCSKTFIS